MIIENSHNLQSNLENSLQFSVTSDAAKLFSMLSTALYSNKEMAVITELCSNALDAHKMVDKEDMPIRVSLPTALQKEFKVRDFGPGLSTADVYEFLTKYGSSSKGKTNDFIGGFGIGSKSPAAVTDTWTINSHFQGEKTSYLVHINENGIPSINKLFNLPTDESGLEIIVPTKTHTAWHDSAKKVFEHYEVMPDLKGISYKFDQHKYKFDFYNLYKLSNLSGGYYNDRVKVVMNRRAYLIDLEKINLGSLKFESNVILPFETSTLSVSLSREDLQYDTKTKTALNDRIEEIYKKLVSEWKSKVSVATSVFDYRMKAIEFKTTYGISATTCKYIAAQLKDSYAASVNFEALHSFVLSMGAAHSKTMVFNKGRAKEIKGWRPEGDNIVSVSCDSSIWSLKFSAKERDDILFILKDVHNTQSRIHHAFNEGIIKKWPIILEQGWFDLIPNDFPKMLASSLDKAPSVAKAKKQQIASEIYRICGRHFERTEESKLDKTADIVAITFTKATSVETLDAKHHKFWRQFSKDGNTRFIFIRTGKELPSYAITPEEWLERRYNELIGKKTEMERAAKYHLVQTWSGYYGIDSLVSQLKSMKGRALFQNTNTVIGKKTALIKEILDWKVDLTLLDDFVKLREISAFLNKPTIVLEVVTKESLVADEILATYPMLNFISSRLYEDDMKYVVDYVNLVGK